MTTVAITYASAILDRLDLISGLTVLDGEVKTTPAGAYVVLYDDSPRLWADRLSSAANRLSWTVRLVCVGRDANETRWVVGKVQASLTNLRLDVSRSAGWLVPQNDGAPLLRDESVPLDIRFSQTPDISTDCEQELIMRKWLYPLADWINKGRTRSFNNGGVVPAGSFRIQIDRNCWDTPTAVASRIEKKRRDALARAGLRSF